MKILMTGLTAALVLVAATQPAGAYSHANRFGGSTSHGWGGTEHTNAWGGNTAHAWGGGTEHTNVYGGHTQGEAGYGAEHTNMYGGTTTAKYGDGAYHSTPYYGTAYYPHDYDYGYHPPATVNYYGDDCYNCGGWDAAGAAVAGAVVGATVATAAESANSTTETDQRIQRGRRGGQRAGGGGDLHDGCDVPEAAGGLHRAEGAGCGLLPLWKYVVPAHLRRERRVLQGRADSLTRSARDHPVPASGMRRPVPVRRDDCSAFMNRLSENTLFI